ncbi:MAG: DUF2783 domain-containing protein [Reyranellaceae bacterium]
MTESALRRELGIAAPDDFYSALADCYRDLDEKQVSLFNARLILLLANQVGDGAVLQQALRAAREGL